MTVPPIWPRSGVSGRALHIALQDALNRAVQVPPTTENHLPEYARWVSDEAGRLRSKLASTDIDRLIRTSAYFAGLAMAPGSRHAVPFVNHEMAARQDALREVVEALEQFEVRCATTRPTTFALPDTNLLLEHPGQLSGVDWFDVLADYLHAFDDVRVVIPLAVVDELDNLKRVHRTSKLASRALKQLYGYFGGSVDARPALREATADHGRISIELLMESPGHVRLPHMDDELIRITDRLSAFTERKPVFVTYDAGAAFRASAAGLPHVRLTHAEGS